MVYIPGVTAPLGSRLFRNINLLNNTERHVKPVKANRTETGLKVPKSVKFGTGNIQKQKSTSESQTSSLLFASERYGKNNKDKGPKRVKELVELVDLFPTLAELAGLKPVKHCPVNSSSVILCSEGTSMVPLINNAVVSNSKRNYALSYLLHRLLSNKCDNKRNSVKHVRLSDRTVVSEHMKLCENKFHEENAWKKAAFSQYPRPDDLPVENSDKPRLAKIKIMGYSIRTSQYHYTEWVGFDPATFKMNWTDVHARELYMLTDDEVEMNNVAALRDYQGIVTRLSYYLHLGWRYAKTIHDL